MTSEIATLIAGGAALFVAGLAVIMLRFAADFTRRNSAIFTGFAGGLVVGLALLHLIPEAFEMTDNAPWLLLTGFAIGFVINALAHSSSGDAQRVSFGLAIVPVIAIGLHSALDGLIYAVSFQIDIDLGLSAAIGLILHEFPEALVCFVLLQRAGLSDGRAFWLAILIAGGLTFGFSAASLPFIGALDPYLLGSLFALVAGLLLHVGASHLLHEAQSAGLVRGTLSAFAGVLVASLVTLTHGEHAHGGAHDHHAHGHDHVHDHHDHEH